MRDCERPVESRGGSAETWRLACQAEDGASGKGSHGCESSSDRFVSDDLRSSNLNHSGGGAHLIIESGTSSQGLTDSVPIGQYFKVCGVVARQDPV